ncbi:MAG: LysM peptidoglycan-binding domain-containing protein [Anaeromicrobium sp.]|jgi:nucleoid-associated protein YgaU|uniref:LysM peptidoglycan-binding domain-containing protein n=1 Tax=Anaeromicrobium sp. TaxID=1929132 RepID=UPI0025E628BF|nr:LysM peptidoglycan-binding domain-containing protein [Anaeromicrobium sp.]MCT4593187.1 LysM peptidoglycan-binding domain-containing protein [Anaeromicrobium sp.]
MDVYLINDKEKSTLHFPVNPFFITVNRNKRYETVDIIDFGEVDFSDKGKKIKELTMDTLLPAKYDTYCKYSDIPKPIKTMQKLEKWMNQKEPLRLIVTDFGFNELVNIVTIHEEERAGETGDKYITLNFRMWRELKIETVVSAVKKTSGSDRNKQLKRNRSIINYSSKTYTVKPKDSLYKIAKKTLKDGSRWSEIYSKNKKVIGKDPNRIYPGQKLVI